jgi:hypothetical protein
VVSSAPSTSDLTTVPPPPELFASDGSTLGTTIVGAVDIGCVGGADVVGVGGADAVGVGGTRKIGIGWEWYYPSIGCARLGGARC